MAGLDLLNQLGSISLARILAGNASPQTDQIGKAYKMPNMDGVGSSIGAILNMFGSRAGQSTTVNPIARRIKEGYYEKK